MSASRIENVVPVVFGAFLRRVFPWGVQSAVRSVLLTAGCGVGLIVVWWGAAGQGVFARQMGWLAAGVMVLLVSLYSHASTVIRGRRALGERRGRLLSDELADLMPRLHELAEQADEAAWLGSDRSVVVVVEGFPMFHLPGCAMTTGREVTVSGRDTVAAELERCGICCRSDEATLSVGPVG